MNSLSHCKTTADIASWVFNVRSADIDDTAKEWAKHCLLDWFGVAIAAVDEPLSKILREEALADGVGEASIIGHSDCVTPLWAVLVNGATGHALDFDDVNERMIGHPTVALFPGILTAAEQTQASGKEVLEALVIGHEVASELGAMTGYGHYEKGFHVTATVGAIAAAAATSVLLRLDRSQIKNALGIAVSQASGLKAMFGSMSKPFQVGKAAQNGYLAARLAKQGFTASSDAIEADQGFWATQAPEAKPFKFRGNATASYAVTKTLFKYHAACYLTHPSIDALSNILAKEAITAGDISKIELLVPKQILGSCNIQEPLEDLECKFSLRHVCAMVLAGLEMSRLENYTLDVSRQFELAKYRSLVEVVPQDWAGDTFMRSDVIVHMNDGGNFTCAINKNIPETDVHKQWKALSNKAENLMGPVLGQEKAERLIKSLSTIETCKSINELLEECR